MQLRMMVAAPKNEKKKTYFCFFVWLFLWLCCSTTTMKSAEATSAMGGGGGFGIEFGQFRPVSRLRNDEGEVVKVIAEAAAVEETNELRKTGGARFEELLKEDRAWWENTFSMSMSSSNPAVPTTAPSKPNANPNPTDPADPTQPAPGGDGGDGDGTTVPSSPTGNPPNATVPPIDGLSETVFTCTDDGVQIAEPPYESATSIQMRVGYEVESVADLDDYRDDLEYMILRTAVIGALQCNAGGPIFGTNGGDGVDATNNRTLNVPMTTTVQSNEQCQPQLSGTTCTVYETEFQFVVEEEVDSELAAFLGYVFLQEEMDGSGAFTDAVPIIDRIKYLSPLPLLPPISDGIDQDPSSGQSGSNNEDDMTLNVSPWTVGAVLAMCIGGIVALVAWARNRRTRNERHMQLLESEDVSLNPLPEDALPRTT